jgi:hypothetical protein
MLRVEAALTASIRLVAADAVRGYGRGGVCVRPGVVVGLSDVARDMAVDGRLPSSLALPTVPGHSGPRYKAIGPDVAPERRGLIVFSAPAWRVLSNVRGRASTPTNLAVIASTPPDALQVHYDFLRGCLSAPPRFDAAAFEAAEAPLRRDADADADLSGLLEDRGGAGPLLTAAMRAEIAALLGASPLRAAVSASEGPAASAAALAAGSAAPPHPADLDGVGVKAVFLVAQSDGRSPLLDPASRAPIMVRAVAPLEDVEAAMTALGKAGRRALGASAAIGVRGGGV